MCGLKIFDDACCHADFEWFKEDDVNVFFFIDQAVLELMKNNYRSQFLNFFWLPENNAEDDYIQRLNEINIVDVIRWIAESWNQVRPLTTIRSWRNLLNYRPTDKCWGEIKGTEISENNDDLKSCKSWKKSGISWFIMKNSRNVTMLENKVLWSGWLLNSTLT